MPVTGRPPLPRTADWSPPTRAHSSPPMHKSSRNEGRQEQEDLFEPPPDLICPISHEVFSDPVLNSAGQVYERSSIEQHLARHNTDPITGSRLPSKVLTPVYFLKSRAAEFREAAARSCVERATALGTTNAIRFVRRAVELCDALSAPVTGLSNECAEYVKAHPSNVYDLPALHLFARGLLQAGLRDKAAAVYFTLLQEGADKAQQAGLLKQCLACWNLGAQAASEDDTVDLLVQFTQQSEAPAAVQIVDIAQEAKLEHSFISKYCEQLLFHQDGGPDVVLTPTEWTKQKQILLKFVQVSCSYIARQQAVADARMTQKGANAKLLWQVMEAGEQLQAMVRAKAAETVLPGGAVKQAERNKRSRLVAAVCLVGSSLLKPELATVRLVKAASLLAVLHFS